jgi:adenosylcobinamide-phosphate synthase
VVLFSPDDLIAALLLALALDALAGDPDALYRSLPHPVVLIGRAISAIERRWLDPALVPAELQRRGRLATLAIVGASGAIGLALEWLCLRLPYGWLPLGVLLSSLIAQRSLHDHVLPVADALPCDLAAARHAVSRIVGRDPEALDEHGVARAAIESTAENFADGVVAPVLFALLLGLPGALAYKAINTLDSMIGHRSPRYLHFGRFAAQLDDVANWLPARLAAVLLLVAAALVPGTDPAAAWQAILRDAPRHRSPNAGWPEAAMAGALGLRLAGPRRYGGSLVADGWMGDGRAAATAADIGAALKLFWIACALQAALVLALGLLR